MRRFAVLTAAFAALLLIACGGGDKKADPTPRPTERPAATEQAPEDTPEARATEAKPTESAGSGGSTDALGAVFSSVLGNGLSGGGAGGAGLGTGDESLKALLPSDSDFPDGYTPFGSFTFSTPATGSEFGAVDMAMTMAVKGDPSAFSDPSNTDLSSIEMLMAMVMRPEDLQALGDAFAEIQDIDPADIEDEINSALGEMQGFEVQRFEVLDGSDLGDGGFGMEMTIDLTGLAGLFGSLGGGEDAPELGAMTMRMYIFGQGDYIGAVLRMGFTDSLGGGSEDIELAEAIEGKLAAAN
jgi:hypothetical protein